MTPGPGERLVRFVGDQISFTLGRGSSLPAGWQARLRTNLGRGDTLRREIINAHSGGLLAAAQEVETIIGEPVPAEPNVAQAADRQPLDEPQSNLRRSIQRTCQGTQLPGHRG